MVLVQRISDQRGESSVYTSWAFVPSSSLALTRHRPELAWLGTETNQFGTDEFMKWCEVMGTEPYLCLNFGTGGLDEGMFNT